MQLGLGMNLRNVLSPNAFKALLNSGKGVWDINYSTLRLKRYDDDFEKEFPAISTGIDKDSIDDFASWNLLNGSEYKDYLYDSPLGVDTDGGGVSDDWWTITPAGVAILRTVENNRQKFELELGESTVTSASAIRHDDTTAVEGDEFIFKVSYETINTFNTKFYIALRWVDSGDSTISLQTSSEITTDDEGVLTVSATAPAGTVEIQPYIYYRVSNTNGGGIVYISDAVLVKNSFIEDIGLLTEDDDSDGVANGWSYLSNTFNGTVVKSVSETGQKLEITSGGSNTNEPFLLHEIRGISDGQTYEISVELRTSGDVSGKLILTETPTSDTEASSNFSGSDWQTITLSTTIDDGDTVLQVKPRLVPNQVGSTGYVEYRNATLKQTNNSVHCTAKYDYTGNGNHATQETASKQPRLINDGVWEVDSNGNYALYYDGVDDCFDVTDNQGLDISSGGLSIVAKHDPDAFDGYLISRNNDASNTVAYGILFNDSEFATSLYLNGTYHGINDGNQDFVSKIAIGTLDFINGKFYLDGTLKDTGAYSTALTSQPNIQIGCRSNSVDGLTKAFFYEGHITHISVYDKALTQAQVDTIYKGLTELFTPDMVDTALWLDASDASTITESGGLVSSWADKSGNGNHATQGTADDQPSTGVNTLGGKNVIKFDNDYFDVATISGIKSALFVTNNLEGHITITSVAPIFGDGTAVTTSEYTFVQANVGDGAYDISIDGDSGASNSGNASVNGGALVSGGNINLGQTNVENEASNVWYADYDNAIPVATVGKITSITLTGDIAELILLDAVPSEATRQKLEGYLAHKWGLTSKLPVDHPYKTIKPRR